VGAAEDGKDWVISEDTDVGDRTSSGNFEEDIPHEVVRPPRVFDILVVGFADVVKLLGGEASEIHHSVTPVVWDKTFVKSVIIVEDFNLVTLAVGAPEGVGG
tara:strand:+ start:3826 stop:4131 length:306 start_codon:yes stop_codon:yes gene_type:complete